VWTLDGAYATFEEKIKGNIMPGKLADFVVLGADPRKVSPLAIKDIAVDATYVGGTRVFAASGAKVALRPPPFPPYGVFGDGDEDNNLDQGR
jgi:hypothetical protein